MADLREQMDRLVKTVVTLTEKLTRNTAKTNDLEAQHERLQLGYDKLLLQVQFMRNCSVD